VGLSPELARGPGAGLAARAAALAALMRVLNDGVALDEALESDRALARLDARDRAFVRALLAACLRRLGQIDVVLAAFIERPLPDSARATRAILRLGAAQLLVLDSPPHAVVDTAVRLAEANGAGRMKGLINAVLRRCDREGRTRFAEIDAGRANMPGWLWDGWSDAYGERTVRAIAAVQQNEPPLDITLKNPADAARWAEALDATILPGGALRRTRAGRVTELPGFDEGAWWVQDAAAALPARVLLDALGDAAGRSVIDLCAAPGGKTAQLAAAGAKVIAVDRSKARLDVLRGNLDRLGLKARAVVADAANWEPGGEAAAVLLDAPCTATGTIRRHPDIPWVKRADSAAAVTASQDALLAAAAKMVRPGGVLVYSVCSLQPEEGAARIEALLAARDDFAREPIDADAVGAPVEALTPEGDLRTLPCHMAAAGGMDGFFIARLRRTGG
jgi:16S rRNA (cytosine967-C5)-methyltransferase